MTDKSAYDMAVEQFDNAVSYLDLTPGIAAILRQPRRSLTVHFPIKMDDDSVRIYTGYRVQHSHVLGPSKGGIRYHPSVTLDEIKAMAMWMTWKSSLVGLPYGGGKGGVICNPKEMSLGEVERLTRRYTTEIMPIIGPMTDIPAPDVNTNPQIMAWFMDTYNMNTGVQTPGIVTGKPVEIGGSLGRSEATGRGVMFTATEALKNKGIDPQGATVVVQGYGNVGSVSACLLQEQGAKVIGVSDSSGGIYRSDGLDALDVLRFKRENASVVGYPGAEVITNEELLALPCDLLVPAALEGALTSRNAGRVNAKIIAEGANGPTTPEADEILQDKGIFIIPDILANAGGVIVSYFEWVQDLHTYYWSEEEVNARLRKYIIEAFDDVVAISREKGVGMRIAAYIKAIARVARALELRGVYP
jgi:glutamate dehydrogenase (NAD(P)+)